MATTLPGPALRCGLINWSEGVSVFLSRKSVKREAAKRLTLYTRKFISDLETRKGDYQRASELLEDFDEANLYDANNEEWLKTTYQKAVHSLIWAEFLLDKQMMFVNDNEHSESARAAIAPLTLGREIVERVIKEVVRNLKPHWGEPELRRLFEGMEQFTDDEIRAALLI